jgi:hypothetical protein
VFQWRSVHASYYTPMDLRAFPFDRQQLLIQVGSVGLGGCAFPVRSCGCIVLSVSSCDSSCGGTVGKVGCALGLTCAAPCCVP